MPLILHILNYIGVFVFALSGALLANRQGRDIYAIILIAGLSGMGGGFLRDITINRQPPIFLSETSYLFVVIFAALLVAIAAPFFERKRLNIIINYLDSMGLAVFTLLGIEDGLRLEMNWHASIFLGVLTAVAGGTMRDILLGRNPVIISRDIYATPPILGGFLYLLLLHFGPEESQAELRYIYFTIAATFIVLLRIISFHKDLHLPIPLMRQQPMLRHSLKNKKQPFIIN